MEKLQMTTLSDIGQTVAQFAPLLGGVIAGPAGAAVGSIVAAKFGGNTQDLEDLNKRISRDPEAQIKCLQIQSDHEIQLQSLIVTAENNRITAETNQLKIQTDDIANARTLQDVKTRTFLIAFTSSLILICLYCVRSETNMNEAELSIISLVLGGALTEWKAIMNFFFGTSIGSKKKDDVISNFVKN
jgi:hypothetical protein